MKFRRTTVSERGGTRVTRPSSMGGPFQFTAAFTLIEVTIAVAIFFVALFAILDLVMQNVRAARSLNQMGPTAGMVAAELSMTNKLSEGSEQGDFGELYPEYSWSRDITEYHTNGIYQVDIAVYKEGAPNSSLSILLYRPESDKGGIGGGGRRKLDRNATPPPGTY